MLIRFVIGNFFSFGKQKEFLTIPNKELHELEHHKYSYDNFSILKMASIYGANGAGKSNLIKSLLLLQTLIVEEHIPYHLQNSIFKFYNFEDNKKQTLAIEFIQNGLAFYYAIVIEGNNIIAEELYKSGLGKQDDELIYERKTDAFGNISILFHDAFERDEKSMLLKSVLLEDFVMPNKPILKLLSKRDNKFLKDAKIAYSWFQDTLRIITPATKPVGLAHTLGVNPDFNNYANDLMRSFNIGITELVTEQKDIKEFFNKLDDNQLYNIIKDVENSHSKMVNYRSSKGDDFIIMKRNGKIWVKTIKVEHEAASNKSARFDLREESDGTVRLLDFLPAFKSIISENKVFIIDEIERSIHPLLVKELVSKFSLDQNSCGQLIFATHEANLLDLEIFRKDEIWFVEKNKDGATDLYSLNDFKELKTNDIKSGYLDGRYGSIPFLGNLKDLNWHNYDTTE